MGWSELEGIANRGDFDLTQHMRALGREARVHRRGHRRALRAARDRARGRRRPRARSRSSSTPTTRRRSRAASASCSGSIPRMAPVKVAVLPLVNKDGQPELAREIYEDLRERMPAEYDTGGSIGKRYRRQDEIGTPWGVTVDHQTLEDRTVTLRDRDSLVSRTGSRSTSSATSSNRAWPRRGGRPSWTNSQFSASRPWVNKVLDAAALRASAEVRRLLHARPRARGRRTAARASSTASRTSADTWRATCSTASAGIDRARGGRRPAGLRHGVAARAPARCCRSSTASARAVVRRGGPTAARVVVGNSLGGCVALRLAEREDLPLAGIVPVAPAGLDMARWFGIIERDPVVRIAPRVPVPLPEAACAARWPGCTAGSPSSGPGEIEREGDRRIHQPLRRPRARSRGYLATGRALLPELTGPVPARPGRAARCCSSGASATRWSTRGRRSGDRRGARRAARADRGLRPLPAARSAGPVAELLLDFAEPLAASADARLTLQSAHSNMRAPFARPSRSSTRPRTPGT